MAILFFQRLEVDREEVVAGGAVLISADTVDSDGVLTTPGTSITVTIYDPNGAAIVSAQAMTTGSTGKHTYTYQTVTTKRKGRYVVECAAVHTGTTQKAELKGSDSFRTI